MEIRNQWIVNNRLIMKTIQFTQEEINVSDAWQAEFEREAIEMFENL